MAKRARRTRTSHQGVKLRKRTWASGAVTWFARWRDPDSGREVDTNLTTIGLTTDEARREWAHRKSKAMLKRAAALEHGDAIRTETPLAEAVADYIATCRATLEEHTTKVYADDADRFVAWAARVGVTLAEELTPARLALYRDAIATGRRMVSVKGGKSGTKVASDSAPAPRTINTRLLHAKALLNHLRRLGKVPALTSDAIRDALRPVKVPKPLPVTLEAPDLRRLLGAVLRHDAATFDITRAENAAGLGFARQRAKAEAIAAGRDPEAETLPTGSTPRYEPAGPFLLTVLLTGMRVDIEACALRWSAVRLEADGGRGEIRLGVETKTDTGRIVDLAPCPVLRRLLATMKLKAGASPFVFGGAEAWGRARVEAVRRRLVSEFGAPRFAWKDLRSTCQSYLVNASGILGDAAPFKAAKRAGHSLAVSEKHYLGVLRGLDSAARDLETVMGVADLADRIVRAAGGERVDVADLEREAKAAKAATAS